MLKTILAAALVAAAAPAFARDSAHRIAVAYADLNLTTAEGIAELDRRIDRAVDRVCPEAIGPYLQEIRAAAKCRRLTAAAVAAQRDAAIALAAPPQAATAALH